MKRALLLTVILLPVLCYAQSFDGSVKSLVQAASKYQAERPAEKLYLQLDRTNYGAGDTLWFKAYLLNAVKLNASAISNVVYIELSNESNVVQLRRLIIMKNGLGSGCIPLNKFEFTEGSYTIRAYTQWMRNFDESYVFKQQFFVNDINRDKWLIHFGSTIENKTAQLHLRLTGGGENRSPVANQQVLLGVKQGDLILRRDKPQIISESGELNLAVSIKDNEPSPVYASLHKGSYDDVAPPYKFPVFYDRAEKTDVQFMPEGGYLVAGINSMIGFKAVGEDGKGTVISGSIVSADNTTVASFSSNTKGMGSFAFTPKPGIAAYKAIVNLPNGVKKEYSLPGIKSNGTVLTVINPGQSDSVIIKVTSTHGLSDHYMLIARSRETVCAAAKVVLINNTKTLKLPKSAFASGVVKFTLLNEQLATLNERMIFTDHHDNLQINVTPEKITYATQDSIALHLEVKDSKGHPISGAFSMSVVNGSPMNNDQKASSILTDLLLTSDLKGDIEDPAYYLLPGHDNDMDNLLLTQGWTAFDWKNILLPAKPLEFTQEKGISIAGKVTNLFNRPVKNAVIDLRSAKPSYDTVAKTDSKGNFTFNDILPPDSVVFIKARNAAGNSSTYGIDLYGYKQQWPDFSSNRLQMPWYVITDTIRQKIADTLIRNEEKEEELENPNGKVLKVVDIKEKKIIKGSHNLNGPGNADQVLDEHDIAKAGKITLLELLKKKVPGFRTQGPPGAGMGYYMGSEPIKSGFGAPKGRGPKPPDGAFIFNGRRAYDIYDGAIYEVLTTYTSEDILGIEVMSKGYTSAYENGFLSGYQLVSVIFPVPYIEITTRDGLDPFKKKAPADIVYKPVQQVLNKQFYRPRYTVKNPIAAAFDNRSIIHWEPNISTDKNGQAIVTFYAAGQPSTYTITTEGSDMNGGIGSSTQKLSIKKPSP